MAFGDVAETVAVGEGFDDGIITATYASATPAANDLNAASCAADAVGATVTTTGFAEVIDTNSNRECALWVELVGGSGDNTATYNDGGAEEPLAMVLSLIRGAFDATPTDLTGESSAEVSDDPVTTGASGGDTAQASEVAVGTFSTFGDESTGAWNRQGDATPTSAMTQSGHAVGGSFHAHQAIQVLTGVGTFGISKVNENADDASLNYGTFKAAAAAADERYQTRVMRQPGGFF